MAIFEIEVRSELVVEPASLALQCGGYPLFAFTHSSGQVTDELQQASQLLVLLEDSLAHLARLHVTALSVLNTPSAA
jgi:hypothetical protein